MIRRSRATTAVFAVILFCVASLASAAITVASALRGQHEEVPITWIALTISNPMSVEANCDIDIQGYNNRGGQGSVKLTLPPIPAGASRIVNIPVPVMKSVSATIREPDGNKTFVSFPSVYGWNNYIGYLHVAEQSNHVSEADLDNFTMRVAPDAKTRYTSMMSGGTGSSATTPTLSAGERVITQASVRELPENWLCYTPLFSVIMAESVERQMTSEQHTALNTWLELGGSLTLYGAEKPGKQSVGNGTIRHVKKNPILDSSYKLETQPSPFEIGGNMHQATMPYMETRSGGRNGAFFLTTLFLIIAGPVNYFYYSRRGQIRKLIVTLPLISLGFCSLIGAYFVITQGFQRKGGTMSVTTIDEQDNRGVTFARHSLLSGLYPLGGFKFNPETFLQVGVDDSQYNARFDLSKEKKLTDGLFQPGIPFNYSTITPFTTRERMLYSAEKSSLRNGFEQPVKAVAVINNGNFYTGAAASAGGEVKLKPVDEANVPKRENTQGRNRDNLGILVRLLGRQSLTTDELNELENLTTIVGTSIDTTTGTVYAALLDGVPKTSDSGIPITDGKNLHVLVGRITNEGGSAK